MKNSPSSDLSFELANAKPLKRKYFLVFVSIFIVTTIAQGIIQYYVSKQQDNSTTINLAGRQRMLSQRLLKQIYFFTSESKNLSLSDQKVAKMEVLYLAKELAKSHQELISGNSKKNLPKPFNNEIKTQLEKLSPLVEELTQNAGCIFYACETKVSLSQIDELSNDYLANMNSLVYKMDRVAKERMKALSSIEFGLYLVIISFMAFEIFKVILPANQLIYETTLRNVQKDNLIKQSEKIGSTGSFEFYPKDRIMRWTDGLFELFSLEKENTQQINLEFLSQLFDKEDQKRLKVQLSNALEKDLRLSEEYVVYDEFDISRTIKLTILKEQLDETSLRVIGLAQDITTQKAIQTELDKERSLAHQHVRMEMVGRLAGGVAHEINNPMAIIHGLIHQAKLLIGKFEKDKRDKEKLMSQLSERLEKIDNASKRIEKTVKGLKSFSSFDQGKVENFMAEEALLEAIKLNFPERSENSKLLKVENCVEGSIVIEGERNRFQEVIINLMTNAIDAIEFSSEEQIAIKLQSDDKFIHISICDQGKGIPKEHLEKVFEPFFTTKDVNQGSGLGLSLAYTIVKEMNGNIKINSQENVGSQFTISLPIKHHEVTKASENKAA